MDHATETARPANPPLRGRRRVLVSFARPDFRLLWVSTVAGFLAMGMQMVGRGYLAYELTGSGAALGMVSLAMGLPQFFVSPFAGVFADRFSKRNILLLTLTGMFVLSLANAVLISTGLIEIWHLVVLGVAQGGVFAFNMPARQAILPAIVGRENLANAIALSNAGTNFVQIAGPAAAGLLIAVPGIGVGGVFYTMAACYLVALLSIVPISASKGQAAPASGSMLSGMADGLRYIARRPSLRRLVVMTSIVVLLAMPFQILMPLFALRVHNVGSEGLGLLSAFTGVGALLGAVVVAYLSASPRMAIYQVLAGLAFGLTLVAFSLAPSYPLALFFVLLVGATSNVYMTLNNTLLMVDSESAMQGRIMSVVMMNFALMPVAAMPMSVIADIIGAPLTMAAAGTITLVVVAWLNGSTLLQIPARGWAGPRRPPSY